MACRDDDKVKEAFSIVENIVLKDFVKTKKRENGYIEMFKQTYDQYAIDNDIISSKQLGIDHDMLDRYCLTTYKKTLHAFIKDKKDEYNNRHVYKFLDHIQENIFEVYYRDENLKISELVDLVDEEYKKHINLHMPDDLKDIKDKVTKKAFESYFFDRYSKKAGECLNEYKHKKTHENSPPIIPIRKGHVYSPKSSNNYRGKRRKKSIGIE